MKTPLVSGRGGTRINLSSANKKRMSGNFGAICFAQYNGDMVAIKRFTCDRSRTQLALQGNLLIQNLQKNSSRFTLHTAFIHAIIRPYGVQPAAVIMEAGGVDLLKHLQCSGKICLDELYNQLLPALQYMHGENIAHRDIKPENMVIMASGTANILFQLIDFDMSGRDGPCGTRLYFKPLYTNTQSQKSPPKYTSAQCANMDKFALGMSMFFLYVAMEYKGQDIALIEEIESSQSELGSLAKGLGGCLLSVIRQLLTAHGLNGALEKKPTITQKMGCLMNIGAMPPALIEPTNQSRTYPQRARIPFTGSIYLDDRNLGESTPEQQSSSEPQPRGLCNCCYIL